ncbi:nucleoside diphosphate-linked moiety X motif 17-like [Ptychodera flava]|uniref:nucleoside diphosphate-linked moiety X motif 17-like n=1 Tax=Ptychodera flava TaxID=63121 RepID=UPI00396A87DC
MTAPSRVWVYLRKGVESQPQRARFIQSIFDYFGLHGHVGEVSCHLEDNKLIISDCGKDQVCLKRPSFCPIHCINQEDVQSISDDILQRGVDVGVVTLLKSRDRRVLLTRRAKHLRIFPGIWVPPGGHVEINESLFEAGLREFHEETGLQLDPKECPGQILCLWESVYPPYLSRGLPRRHHIVVYLSISCADNHDVLDERIRLQPEEVEASAWLTEEMVRAIVARDEDATDMEITADLPKTFRAKVLKNSKEEDTDLEMSVLLSKAPLSGQDIERVSTGTKFALARWLNTL